MRSKLKQLEKRATGRLIVIAQVNGPPLRFPRRALAEAFLANMSRLSGEEMEPHPLSVAAARSPNPAWRDNFIAGGCHVLHERGEEAGLPEDLSE